MKRKKSKAAEDEETPGGEKIGEHGGYGEYGEHGDSVGLDLERHVGLKTFLLFLRFQIPTTTTRQIERLTRFLE
jgi:hypothetical protein